MDYSRNPIPSNLRIYISIVLVTNDLRTIDYQVTSEDDQDKDIGSTRLNLFLNYLSDSVRINGVIEDHISNIYQAQISVYFYLNGVLDMGNAQNLIENTEDIERIWRNEASKQVGFEPKVEPMGVNIRYYN